MGYESRARVCGVGKASVCGGDRVGQKSVLGESGARERMRVCGKKGAKESVCVCSGGESFARERERVWGERVFWVRIGK